MTVLPYIFFTVLQLLIVYSLMLAFRLLIKTILKSKPVQSRVLFYFNVVCYFIWVVFVLIKVSDSIGENSLFVAPVLLLLLVLMWDYLKNFFLGIIFSIPTNTICIRTRKTSNSCILSWKAVWENTKLFYFS